MGKRQITANALMSVLQVVVTGVVLFLLYRYLLDTIGVGRVGIWSVVLSVTSVASVANLGLSTSGVKFVAAHLARGEEGTVVAILETLLLSTALIIGLVLCAAYPAANWVLARIIDAEYLQEALVLVPYALVSLWVIVLTGVYQAGLDGYQRIDLRSALLMAGTVLHFLLSLLLVPRYGLLGLAYARVIQSVVTLAASWLTLKRILGRLPLVPRRLSPALLRRMAGYGLNFQVGTVSQMVYDPITKALLVRFGGLDLAGFYEMASRMIQQFRALLVSANQVLVPAVADLHERTPEKVRGVYLSSYGLTLFLALPMFAFLAGAAPLISDLWIGRYEASFVFSTVCLCAGWLVNTLAAPAYYVNMGVGTLLWNTAGHLVIGALNLSLGFLGGWLLGGRAVVLAWVASLMIGSGLIPLTYHVRNGLALGEALPRETRGLALACLSGLSLALLTHRLLGPGAGAGPSAAVTALVAAVMVPALWAHPVRRRLTEWASGAPRPGGEKGAG